MVYALVLSVEREHYIDVSDLLVNAVGYNILATNPFIDEYNFDIWNNRIY